MACRRGTFVLRACKTPFEFQHQPFSRHYRYFDREDTANGLHSCMHGLMKNFTKLKTIDMPFIIVQALYRIAYLPSDGCQDKRGFVTTKVQELI